jgi:hypothetical protein
MKILHAIHSANPKGGGPIEGLKQLSMENNGTRSQKKWLYWPWAEYRVLRDARAVFSSGRWFTHEVS